MKIRLNIGVKSKHKENYYLIPLYNALKLHEGPDLIIEETDDIPFLNIEVDNRIVGLISYGDGYPFSNKDLKRLNNNIKFIFKYHYNKSEYDYSDFLEKYNIYPIGLWRSYYDNFDYQYLISKKRDIDVQARMRTFNSGGSDFEWSNARRTLQSECNKLKELGYNTYTDMINRAKYMESLKDTKIGFLWSASANLGWKIPEFCESGVIMISEKLGKDNPLVNNTIFEDNFNYIECNNPHHYKDVALELLNDPVRLNTLKKNVLDTWNDKLHPYKVGEYLLNIIKNN